MNSDLIALIYILANVALLVYRVWWIGYNRTRMNNISLNETISKGDENVTKVIEQIRSMGG